ncbi:MAG: GntR family transcriptional regulator [Bacteroidota bacterium]
MSYSPFYQKIYDLKDINSYSKHEQLVRGIINAIDDKTLKKGDKLPSINEMVSELGYARKTIVKAYEELKDRGIVESKKLKGYFVASEETGQTLKVALILFAFHSFQEDFYNTFRSKLGKNIQLDVFFHHNNEDLFETILSNIDKKYGMYVIAPIQSETVRQRLLQFPPEKLLLVDRHIDLGKSYSYITQEFEETTFEKLSSLLPQISTYKKTILYYREDADYPVGIKLGFEHFLKAHNIQGSIEPYYELDSLKKEQLHIFISDNNLFQLLRDCSSRGWVLGKDIGVISHNDNIVKDILAGGITTISTDFKSMALLAASYVNERQPIQSILPSTLVDRKSL